jgi:hypothetical protein
VKLLQQLLIDVFIFVALLHNAFDHMLLSLFPVFFFLIDFVYYDFFQFTTYPELISYLRCLLGLTGRILLRLFSLTDLTNRSNILIDFQILVG